MSDLHKQFLRRIKQQEQSMGLSSLSEEGEEGNSVFQKPIAARRSRNDRTKENHDDILGLYNSEKDATFDVIEKWHDESTGVSFNVCFMPPKESQNDVSGAQDIPESGKETGTVFIGCHGAGSSAMAFCKLAKAIRQKSPYTGMLVFDMRGHGLSSSPGNVDFSLDTLTNDFKFIIEKFLSRYQQKWSLYLIGHSLGGSVVTNYLKRNPGNGHPIKGLIMLDIVEETAITSLTAMPKFLERMPKRFYTYKQALDWHTKATGLFRNTDSAYVSVPDLFVDNGTELQWKLDLSITQPFWETWFAGLSQSFVDCGKEQGVAKLLILAGHETLDTNLIIGQMQGKYQLIVFNNPKAGHFLHQDIPDELSISLLDFSKRNDSPEEYMKQELGFVPRWGGKVHT